MALKEGDVVEIGGYVFTVTIGSDGRPYLLYEGRPLGCLRWGHGALLAALGPQYASHDAWRQWLDAVGRDPSLGEVLWRKLILR